MKPKFQRSDVTAEMIREFVSYDPETGLFKWLPRDRKWFARQCSFTSWNGQFSGKPAFRSVDSEGYLTGNIFHLAFKAHRVAFAHFHGRWPKHSIDHKNGNRSDNRIENLRDVSRSLNMRNRRLSANNTSGVNGVYWHKSIKRWVAYINTDEGSKTIGSFVDKDDAVAARRKAEKLNSYHPNHGRAA